MMEMIWNFGRVGLVFGLLLMLLAVRKEALAETVPVMFRIGFRILVISIIVVSFGIVAM